MALLQGHELGSPRLCCGADAVQQVEGDQPLEQMDALKLGDRRLLLVLGALAVERAEVGGESRLLLGRVLVVLEHGVGLGRVTVHRVAEEEKELGASVWLVSDVACQQSIQQVIYSAPGARWAGSGLPLPFGAETPLPLPLAQQPALGAGGWCGRGVPWVWLAG
eukprot:scaffold38080_cov53-Phaeocystis_antarctica.AAC.1